MHVEIGYNHILGFNSLVVNSFGLGVKDLGTGVSLSDQLIFLSMAQNMMTIFE